MGKNSGPSTQTVQTNSTSGPPQWAQNASKDLYNNSMNVADGMKATQFADVAPMSDAQRSLFGMLMGNVGSANGTYGNAINTMTGLQGFKAPTIDPKMLAGTDLSPYMNPYTKDVIDTSLATGRQELAKTQNQTADAASAAGAFGGSRHGVVEGVNNAQYDLGAAGLAANLNNQNFMQAQGAAATDIGNDLTAQSQNAGNAITGAGVNLAAANGAVSAAGQQQQTYLNSLFAALMGQNQMQGQTQAENQTAADRANAQNMLPYQRLQVQQNTLNGVPLAQTTTGTQTATKQEPSNGLMQTLGGILGIGSSIAGLGGVNGFGLWGGK